MSRTLYLLDGSALVYRAFFALQRTGLMSPAGEPTGAVFGFANALAAVVSQDRPDYLAVVFDARGPTFRHEMYDEYKANRSAMPDELRDQIPRVKELVDAWPCAAIEVPGVEADDVIGSYAHQLAGPDLEVVAVTGDKDFYQILSPHTRILDPGRGGAAAVQTRVIGPDDVPAKFGVAEPERVIDVLALMGDSSDNVPGVPGIGPKTAGQLVREHGSVEEIYRHLDRLRPALRRKLEENRESAELSRELVTIRTDLPLPRPLEDLESVPPQGDRLIDLLEELGFRRLLSDLGLERSTAHDTPLFSPQDHHRLITDSDGLGVLADRLSDVEAFSLDVQLQGADPRRADLVGMALAVAPGEAFYVNLGHAGADGVGVDAVGQHLGPVLADPDRRKIAHDGKRMLIALRQAGLTVRGLDFDTAIASYLLDPEGSHRLEDLAVEQLGESPTPMSRLLGKGASRRTLPEIEAGDACRSGAEAADLVLRLAAVQRPRLEAAGLRDLFETVEMPLLFVLRDMQWRGVAIDVPVLEEMSRRLDRERLRLEAECHRLADREFNVNSPPQLAEVLFDHLGLPRGKKTKTGYSTDSEVLEGLRLHHELPGVVLEYRQMMKLKSTYVDALPALVHSATGRIHTTFNQTVAATGRLSSSDPNLQNIPIRTPLGREVRRAFVPGEPGWVLVSADYSQIELRIMAHLSRDPALRAAFRDRTDVHRDTAARLFGVDPEAVTERQRMQAKAVNFGVLYGQGPYGLARTLGIPTQEASAFIRAYKETYAGVVDYLEGTLDEARRQGYVTTLLGRRRYLPQLKTRSPAARAAAERLAINTPIQGSAADLIKVAMVDLHRRMQDRDSPGHLLLQVHDELVLECPEAEAARLSEEVRETMEGALTLDVPVVVNIGIGASWAEIH